MDINYNKNMGIHIKNVGECQCRYCGTILPKTTKPAGKIDLYRVISSTFLLLGASCNYIHADIEFYICEKCDKKMERAFNYGCITSIVTTPIIYYFSHEYIIKDVFFSGMIAFFGFILVNGLAITLPKSFIHNNNKVIVNAIIQDLENNGWVEAEPRGDSGVLKNNSDKNMDFYGLYSLPQKYDIIITQD